MTLADRIARLERIVALIKALDRCRFACEVTDILAQIRSA